MARAVWFRAPRRVEVGEVELSDPGPGEVLVRTWASGISTGTELLAYRGQLDPSVALDETLAALGGAFTYPFRYGYSCVGRVERSRSEVGEGAAVFAFHPHQDAFVVPASDVVVLDEPVDAARATLLPLVETALQLSLDAGDQRHEPVVVTGLGVVGLLTAVLLARAGADVVGVDPVAGRRALAASLGLAAVGPGEVGERVAAGTDGGGVPLLVEASGNPAALADGLDLLAHEGVALVASWYGTKPVTLPLGGAFHRRRLTVRSSQVSTVPARLSGRWTRERRRAAARDLLGRLPLDGLVGQELPFQAAASAYEALDRGAEGPVHVVLRYQ